MLKINPQTGETEEISLFDLLDGGVKELAALNLRRVLDNIRDVNTDAKKTRSLTVKFTFLPNEDRDTVNVDIAVDCKTVPVRGGDHAGHRGGERAYGCRRTAQIHAGAVIPKRVRARD